MSFGLPKNAVSDSKSNWIEMSLHLMFDQSTVWRSMSITQHIISYQIHL